MNDQGLANSSTIPPPPSFADFRFSTIGQEPPLLKRFSTQTSDLHLSSCPSSPGQPELEYPSAVDSPRPRSRPTLYQSLGHSNSSGVRTPEMTASHIHTTAETPDAREMRSAQLPHSSQHISSSSTAPLDAVAGALSNHTSVFISSSDVVRPPVIYTSTITQRQTPLPATSPSTAHQTHSSYAALRALRERLVTSLSKLHPPDMTDALLRVQSANLHSVNAITTAHRSYILAQQSLTTAQEAVAAAQECANAAEQARTHANDALTAIRQLHSGKAGLDAEGSADWQWKVNYIQLQDDLRILGEWVSDRTGHIGDQKPAEAETGVSGLGPHVAQDINLEAAQRFGPTQARRSAEAPRVTPRPDLIPNQIDHRRSLELEVDTAATQAEQNHASMGLLPVNTDVVPMEVKVNLPPKAEGGTLQDAREPVQTNEEHRLSARHQDVLSRYEARLQVQNEAARLREPREKGPQVSTFQITHREQMATEDLPENAVNGSRLKLKKNPTIVDKPQQPQAKSSVIVQDAKHASQVYKNKEAALAGELESKQIETLEEQKKKELAEQKKEQEKELTAAEEQVLIAEQEKRRQEVMAQKQRATAETAARINAERARERERAMVIPSHSPTSSIAQPTLPDRSAEPTNLNAKQTTISKPTKKPKSLSGGVKLGFTTDGQHQPMTASDLSPSPVLARSAALGLRPSKAKEPPSVNIRSQSTKSINVDSKKATSIEKSSQGLTVALRAPTPTNGRNGVEDLQVHRHSDDPGNLCVVPRSQVVPASPEAQAANLRFVKDGNGARTLLDLKPQSKHPGQSATHRKSPVSIKKESPTSTPLVESQTQPLTNLELSRKADPSANYSLPPKPHPSTSLSSNPTNENDALTNRRGATGTSQVAPAPLTIVSPFVSVIDTLSAAPPSNTRRPPSNTTPANPHRDNSLPPRNSSKPLAASKPTLNTQLAMPDMNTVDPISPDDAAQIAPLIHSSGGWNRPVDEEAYSEGSRIRDPTPLRHPRKKRRGGDHYSPPPRDITPNSYTSGSHATRSISPKARSPILPAQRSPVLGKRRQREDVWEDEPPPRRRWPTDGTRRTRSPPLHLRQTTQWRPASPDRPALQARMQVSDYPSMSNVRLPPSRELAWRSPSPDRPALQARIGVRDPVTRGISGDRSYRPTYFSETYERPQPRIHDNYQSGQADQFSTGYRLAAEPEPRGPSHGRGRGNMNGHRASPRGRGNRGGNRFLNLEQRISSSTNPLTLMNRLENPSRN